MLGNVGKIGFRGGEKSTWEQVIEYIRVACFARYRVILSAGTQGRLKTGKKTARNRTRNAQETPKSGGTPRSTISAVQSLNQKVNRLYSLITPRNRDGPALHHSFVPGSASQRVLFSREDHSTRPLENTNPEPDTYRADSLDSSLLSRLHSCLSRFSSSISSLRTISKPSLHQRRSLLSLFRSLRLSRHQKQRLRLSLLHWRLKTRLPCPS